MQEYAYEEVPVSAVLGSDYAATHRKIRSKCANLSQNGKRMTLVLTPNDVCGERPRYCSSLMHFPYRVIVRETGKQDRVLKDR